MSLRILIEPGEAREHDLQNLTIILLIRVVMSRDPKYQMQVKYKQTIDEPAFFLPRYNVIN